MKRQLFFLATLLALAAVFLTACATPTPSPVDQPIDAPAVLPESTHTVSAKIVRSEKSNNQNLTVIGIEVEVLESQWASMPAETTMVIWTSNPALLAIVPGQSLELICSIWDLQGEGAIYCYPKNGIVTPVPTN